ncbi:MAG: Mrr restriction system protein [Nitrospirae bacterium]|nr:Mrr restriction system protein [Nitrospirota bacterium]
MAEITTKRRGELVRKVIEVLKDHPEGLQAKDVLKQVEDSITLSLFEQSTYPNNPTVRRFEKIVRFATIGPVKAGWILKSKGRWSVTEQGLRAYKDFKDPEKFTSEVRRLYRQWAANRPEPSDDVAEEEAEAADVTGTFEEAEESAWIDIERHLRSMAPYDFQNLVAALLRAMGYHVSWIAPPGRDGGIDILAHTDPLGINMPRIKVQVKRRTDKVAVDGLRSFMAVLGDQDVGLFVSAGGFTREAENEARTQEKRKITLLGLEQFFDLWLEHYAKVEEADRQLLPLKPVYFLAPSK